MTKPFSCALFREWNGRVSGVMSGLEVVTCFLDCFLPFVFRFGHLIRVTLTWFVSFSWLLVKLQLFKLVVGQKGVTAVWKGGKSLTVQQE